MKSQYREQPSNFEMHRPDTLQEYDADLIVWGDLPFGLVEPFDASIGEKPLQQAVSILMMHDTLNDIARRQLQTRY